MAATGLSAGMYTCLVSDANGCSAIDTIIITQPAQALNCTIPADISVIVMEAIRVAQQQIQLEAPGPTIITGCRAEAQLQL